MRRLASTSVLVVLVAAGCGHQEAFRDAKQEIGNQDRVIAELQRRNDDLVSRARLLETEVETMRAEVEALRGGRAALDAGMRDVTAQLDAMQARFSAISPDLHLKPTADGLALEVADTVLFEVGRSELSENGKRILGALAPRLKEHPGQIRIEGHTDNRPVVVHAKEYPLGNLQLSGARSLVVADFLIRQGGLTPTQVSYAGFGEHHPVAPNDSPENMARNRRVEIVLVTPTSGER